MILYAAKPELETDTLCTKSLRIEKNSRECTKKSNSVYLMRAHRVTGFTSMTLPLGLST